MAKLGRLFKMLGNTTLLQTFRSKLPGIFPHRADALLELIDALMSTVDPRSPVELSLSPAFRRRFSMVYDVLRKGQVDGPLGFSGVTP